MVFRACMFGARSIRHGVGIVVLFALLAVVPAAQGGPRWMLVYRRQIGNNVNGGAQTLETHVFNENGSKASGIGVTNQFNAGINIFGTTDANGYNRVTMDPNNCSYDILLRNSPNPSQNSPTFFWEHNAQVYSYITHWMFASNDALITTFPSTPVYHYDLVSGLNTANANCSGWAEAASANSDSNSLAGFSTYLAQTFVVPAGINRIVSSQAYVIRGTGDHFHYIASIRQGSPTGTQVGPEVTSQDVVSTQFKEVSVSWGINDVAVTPGSTYALRLRASDGQGFNVFATTSNNYPSGSFYHGDSGGVFTQVPGQDMVAVVVGVGYNTTPPAIGRSPSSFTRTVTRFTNLASDTFNITNTGGGTLDYTISDNANWLSVNPTSGSATAEQDSISIDYSTATLAVGSYQGIVTITAPGASNTPQQVIVNLTVQDPPYLPCDFDQDGDVDQSDFGHFQNCCTGFAYTDPACAGADLNHDQLINSGDFQIFAGCMSGPDHPDDPGCLP